MAQLTSSYWEGAGGGKKTKKPRPVKPTVKKKPQKAPKPVKEKVTTPAKPAPVKPAPVKKAAARPAPQQPVRPKNTKTIGMIAVAAVAVIAAAGGGTFAYTQGAFDTILSSDQPTPSTNSGVIGGPSPETPPELDTSLTLTDIANAIDAAYGPAVHTQGTAALGDGRTVSYDTSWISDGSMGRGTVTLGGVSGEVMLYKNAVLINNDTGLLDTFIAKPAQVTGWIIMVNPSLEAAFPSQARVSSLPASAADDLVFDGDDVTGSGITATISSEVAEGFSGEDFEYTIEPASPGDIEPLAEGFKADGKAELVNDVWEVSAFARD